MKRIARAGFLAIFTPWTRQPRARHNFTSLHGGPRNTILLDFGSLTLPCTVPCLNKTLKFAELNPNPDFGNVRIKRKEDVVFGVGDGWVGLWTLEFYALTGSVTIV